MTGLRSLVTSLGLIISLPAFCQLQNGYPQAPFPLSHRLSLTTFLEQQSPSKVRYDQSHPFYQNLTQGLLGSINWWDFAFAAVTVLPERFRPDEEDERIQFRPLSIDTEVAKSYSRNGRGNSFGSSDPRVFPKIVLGLHLFGVASLDILTNAPIDSRHYERVFVFYKSLFYTKTLTSAAKAWFSRTRPDGSNTHSFFSGHTSITFATSAFCYRAMNELLSDVDPIRDRKLVRDLLKGTTFVALYGWASYVGYSRIRDNRHYLTDVLVGAAAGTVISNLLYSLHFGGDEASSTSRGTVHVVHSPFLGNGIGFRVSF